LNRHTFIVEIDDFFLKDAKSNANKSNFDRARLKEQVLIPLRKGRSAAYQKLLWDTNTLSDFQKIPPSRYVIIDGVSSLHPDIAEYIDYKIWVDTPADVAKERMVKRDKDLGDEHGELWDHWTKSFQMYKDLHKPELRADLVVNHMP
jgi:uridine kinase